MITGVTSRTLTTWIGKGEPEMGNTRTRLEQSVEHWNAHDPAAWVGDFGPDAQVAAPGISGSGTEMVRTLYSTWQDAFPDNEVRPVGLFEDGATAILQAEFHGTHTGTMNAPDQTIPATGRRVTIPFVTIETFDGDKITQFTLYFDRAELLGQLGLLPAPAPA
jgi:predicted ester cyclase